MMTHPTWESLVDHADGRGEAEETQAIAAHLATCAECSQDVAWLRQTMAALRGDAFVAPPRMARLAVLAAFDARYPTPRTIPTPAPRRGYWAPVVRWGLAALAAMLLLVVFWRGQLRAPVAMVGDAVGTVTVQREGQPDRPALPFAPIAPGDFITTGQESAVTLTLLNGNATVTLDEQSNLGIAARPAPNELALETDTAGRVTITVQEPAKVSLTIPYGTLTCEGGSFSVYYLYGDKDHGIEAHALAGSVEFVSNDQEARTLQEGECLVLYRDRAPAACTALSPLPEDGASQGGAEATEEGREPNGEGDLPAYEPGRGSDAEEPEEPDEDEEEAADEDDPADALEERYVGIISEVPSGFMGEWLIGGRSFISNPATELREDKAPFTPGSCVQVRYLPPATVVELRTEDADKCR